jgi:pilus assembly protein CpaE
MPQKILIVDDDVESLKLIGLMLQRHGYEVSVANAGNQGVAKAISEQPDLVILDVMMPDINGYEACRRLRAEPTTQDIPIIMFTAKTLIDDKVAGFEAGADDYLTKPTHPAELISRVQAILERSTSVPKQSHIERGTAIGVIGTKGGIGTTTLTLNIGAAFKQRGENPIVADFRLGSGTLGLYMGIDRPTGMMHMLGKSPPEINVERLENELVTHQSGLRGLLSSMRPKEALLNYPIDSALAVVNGLRSLGSPLVLDLGSGYTPLVNHLHPELDELIVLVEPLTVMLPMARELLHELSKEVPGRPIHVVVVNRSQVSSQPPWHEVEHVLDHEIHAIISAAPEIAFQAVSAGLPIINYQPNAVVSSQINKLIELMNTQTLSDGEPS